MAYNTNILMIKDIKKYKNEYQKNIIKSIFVCGRFKKKWNNPKKHNYDKPKRIRKKI